MKNNLLKIIVIICCVFFIVKTKAQKHTVSGYITDVKTGEKLVGANVFDANTYQGIATNRYGFYSLTLEEKNINLQVSFVGYQTFSKKIILTNDTILNIDIKPEILLQEVTASANRIESKIESTELGVAEIPVKTINSLPVLMGETDVLKSIQLLPGVQSGTEGTSGLYVRGGGPDQNLILLDGVPVYNVNHLFGFFSVFNGDAIQNVKLIKGGFPARYGGRLSSVIDIQMKEGNNKKLSGKIQTGLVASKLTLEGPLFDKNTSFIISGRRTYIDLLYRPFLFLIEKEEEIDDIKMGYYFYDFNGKINHKFSDKSRIYLSFYNGRDKAYTRVKDYNESFDQKSDFKLNWGNITSALRWNYLFSNKLFSNTTLTYSHYKFLTGIKTSQKDKIENTKNDGNMKYYSGIDDWALKLDFDYFPTPKHYIRFGSNTIIHTFHPGVDSYKSNNDGVENSNTVGNKDIHATESFLYAEDDMQLTNRLKMNVGIHFSIFNLKDKTYNSFEPRIAARMKINDKISAKAAFTKMNQYIHLLTNTSVGLPTDLWLPVTKKIKPQNSTQYAVGVVYAINDLIDVSLEGYYKKMNNLIEYKDGATFFSFQGNWEDKVEKGKGKSYGLELLVQKNIGKVTGWIGYTLSKSTRQFKNINNGREFPYRYDRRHDISLALVYKLNENIDISTTWVYGTGNSVTLANEKYNPLTTKPMLENFNTEPNSYRKNIEHFDTRNNFTSPAYHRLDMGISLRKQKKRGLRTWSFGAYNIYNHKNPFFLQFKNSGELKQISLFPIIPYASYKFEF